MIGNIAVETDVSVAKARMMKILDCIVNDGKGRGKNTERERMHLY